MNNEDNKNRFVGILTDTRRTGVSKVIAGLEELGFFTAPASTKFHGSVPGGLLAHSLSVYDQAKLIRDIEVKVRPDLADVLSDDAIAIAALLHDVCKAEVYKEVEKLRKDKNGQWEKYKAYGVDYSQLPLGHGEKSVIRLLRWGLDMTDAEIVAIRWHMSGFDLAFQSPEQRSSYSVASDQCPLLAVLRAADGLASHIVGQ